MTWPRVAGLRALELGSPGALRAELNRLVLAGRKQATTGLATEYEEEGEVLEHAGERLALLDDDGAQVGTVEVTDVQVTTFGEVPWSFAEAEGEGDADLEDWRSGHRRYWQRLGTPVTDATEVVCLRFRLV
ncbi:ASCH domain-containing protein [Nocardioides abyssi]|uniref:ASCH domain-containing protein n=1 Tax=Nocardioides abyssi TaxID=3058370 RepID=A0ABT8EZ95_9ACTN|nr:ASCH domain-containing protein [Nocardioides abyssi]MDN4163512.1 ASCH domain-containing protein [Nocardioides abyssi]